MKHILSKLRKVFVDESVFDDEKDIISKTCTPMYTDDLKDPNSYFRKSYICTEKDKKIVKNLIGEVDDESVIICHRMVFHRNDIGISKFYNNRTKLKVCGSLILTGEGNIVSDDTLAKTIECHDLESINKSIFKNINITLDENLDYKGEKLPGWWDSYCVFGGLDDEKLFDNVFIKMNTKNKLVKITSKSIPVFNKVRCNCKELHIYGPDIFDNSKNKLTNLFEFPYNIKVKESSLDKYINIRDFKNLKSLAKFKKYKYNGDCAIKLKSCAKLSDLIDIKNFACLNVLQISDDEVTLQFDRSPLYHKNNLLNSPQSTYTNDGWRITLYKN